LNGAVCVNMISKLRSYTGWPKKLSHYEQPSFSRIKNRQ